MVILPGCESKTRRAEQEGTQFCVERNGHKPPYRFLVVINDSFTLLHSDLKDKELTVHM